MFDQELALLAIAFPDREPIRLPKSYHADFWLPHESLPPVVVECRMRTGIYGESSTYAISLAKYMGCLHLAESMGGFFHIVSGWADDVIAVAQMSQEKTCRFIIRPGGSSEAGERQPVVHIPIGAFKPIKNS